MALAVASAAVALAFLVLAASSGPVRLWVTPTQVESPAGGGEDPPVITVPQNPVSTNRIVWPSWLMALLPIVGVLLMVLVVLAVMGVRVARPLAHFSWRRQRRLRGREIVPLPEISERDLSVNVEAARLALLTGSPRNAIVACWMQLEQDAAKAGLARLVAETPAEYVERVIVSSSVDPAPINELAALYREARFSRHRLDDADRTRALGTLRRVEATLHDKHGMSA